MPDLTQSSQTTATSAPTYYTNYLTDLASRGTAAGQGLVGTGGALTPTTAAAYDPSALQTSAFTNAQTNVGNYLTPLQTAGTTIQGAGATDVTGAGSDYLSSGTSSAADLVGGYMSPYTRNVVDQIRLANEQNIRSNLSPGITAGAVGGGQFGSQRGANALAQGISSANIGALGEQSRALQAGYSDALKAAQQQRANQMTAGQTAGNLAALEGRLGLDVGTAQANLAQQTQSQGLADVNALATLGGQQRTIAQEKALAPLDILSKQAGVMSGAQLPMTTTSTMTGSPLSAIAGLGALGLQAFQTPAGSAAGYVSPGQQFLNWLQSTGGGTATTTGGASGSGTASGEGSGSNDLIDTIYRDTDDTDSAINTGGGGFDSTGNFGTDYGYGGDFGVDDLVG